MDNNHKSRIYAFDKQEDKQFFAGIFNNFDHNWSIALKAVGQALHIPGNHSVNDLRDKSLTFSLNDWDRMVNKLTYFFPFVNKIKHLNREDFWKFISNLKIVADEYRNYSSHYNRALKEVIINESLNEISTTLEELFKEAVLFTTNQRKQTKIQEAYFKEKYNSCFQKILNNRNIKDKTKEKDDFEYKYVFNHLSQFYLDVKINKIQKDKTEVTFFLKENFKVKTKNGILQGHLFLMFLSFGLNKREFEYVLAHTKYYKANHELKFAFTRWILRQYCLREPKSMLSSQFSKHALLLQIADELSKCPKALYDHLSEKDKFEFFEDRNRFIQESEKDYHDVEHDVLRLRYENKFAYLAIRYLDEFVFKNGSIRFQVNVGKFNHDTAPKETPFFTTTRTIEEKLFVFEKLSEVQKKKTEYFNKLEESSNWKQFPNAHYQFHKNNIAIWISETPVERPEVSRKRQSKSDLLKELGLENCPNQALFYLSFNELSNLLFEVLIKGKDEAQIRTALLKQYNKKLKGKLRPNGIQSRKMKALQNKDQVILKDKLIIQIEKHIKFDIIKDIRKHYTKEIQNEEVLSNTEKGKVAVWLTKDICRYSKKATRKNWKGWQVAELQHYLAFYEDKKHELKGFTEQVLGVKSKYQTLFPIFNFQAKTLEEFLAFYTKQKYKYLRKSIQDINRDSFNANDSIFDAYHKRFYYAEKDTYIKNLKNQIIYLDKGIFDDNPTAGQDKSFVSNNKCFNHTNKSIINSQSFYQFNRIYSLTDKKDVILTKDTQSITEACGNLSKEHENYKRVGEIYKNEKDIRKIQRQDAILLEILKKEFDEDKLLLSDTFKTKKEKKENERISQLEQESSDDQVKRRERNILTKEIDINPFKGKITGQCSLKDLPKYRRLENDSRVKTLITYQPSFSINEIKEELRLYEKVRYEKTFESIFKLEDKIYKQAEANDDVDALKEISKKIEDGIEVINKHLNFKRYISYYYQLEFLNKVNFENLNKADFEKLIEDNSETHPNIKKLIILIYIRNKFAHNQLPPDFIYEICKNTFGEKSQDESYAEFFCRISKLISQEYLKL
jgi:hypothetical protein